MDLARPAYLWTLLLLPLLAWGTVRGHQRRRRDWQALGQGGRPPGDGAWASLAAVGLLVVALAGPRWGRLSGSELPPGHDVVFLVDISRSMAAEDAVPDRLGLAIEAAEALIGELGQEPGNRAAVVAFAGRGVLRCPLTENLGAVVATLRTLHPGSVQPDGTDLGSALRAALDAFEPDRTPEPTEGRTILLLTDGEDHSESAWQSALPALRSARVLVHAITVGDEQRGHPIPLESPGATSPPAPAFLTWRGEPVQTRRHDAAPRAIAEATGGAFLPLGLSPPTGLADLYRQRIAPVARRTRESSRVPERVERYGLFALAALAASLAALWPGPRRSGFGAVAAVALGLGAAGPGPPPAERSVPGGRSESATVSAVDRQAARTAARRGAALYALGDLPGALAGFEQAIAHDPTSALAHHNAAATLFQLGRYAEAAEHYRVARSHAGATLRPQIDYALGNTAVALGDFSGAVAHYDACLAVLDSRSDSAALRRDATINREFALRQREAGSSPEPDAEPRGERPRDEPTQPSPSSEPPAGQPPAPPRASDNKSAPDASPPGTSPAPAPTVADDAPPEERLEAAVRNALQSRDSRRLDRPDAPPASVDDPERKPW